jgi:hypothetical protein
MMPLRAGTATPPANDHFLPSGQVVVDARVELGLRAALVFVAW